MALITTIIEIKAVLPRLVSNLSDAQQLPNFTRAGKKYIVPVAGLALYNDIQTKYTADTLSDDEAALLLDMQLVIAAYAFYDELAFTHTKITDAGIRTLSTNNVEAAHRWEFQELKNNLIEAAIDGTEVLLQTLQAQAPALWTDSAEYTAFKSLLIKTGTEFSSIVKLQQPLRTFWAIATVVGDAQENYLRKSLGPDLLEYLRDKASPTDEELHIIKLLKKALAHFTVRHACEQYSTRFDVHGFTVTTGSADNSETSGQTFNEKLLTMKMNAHERDGRTYLNEAIYECYLLNADAGAEEDFTEAYAAGPLESYAAPADRDKGNATNKIFRM